MTIADLGFDIDSSPLARASVDLEKIVPVAKAVEDATSSMATKVTSTARIIGTAYSDLNTKIANSANDVQARINQMTGVSMGQGNRVADIAAYGQQLDSLRAKFNPLFAAEQQHKQVLSEINMALKTGAITQEEYTSAAARSQTSYSNQVKSIGDLGKIGQLAGYQLLNLNRQIQDIGTMALLGASPFQIISSQGAQVYDVFKSSSATLGGFFNQVKGGVVSMASLIGPLTGSIAGVVGIGAAAVTAGVQWTNAQRAITAALEGVGRASAASVGDLNKFASAGASLSGFSTSEARGLASGLAGTGQIDVSAIRDIVALGSDFAKVYGLDATEATAKLAQGFKSPAKGAEDLMARLGTLNAGTLTYIQTLEASGQKTQAQVVLAASLRNGLTEMGETLKGNTSIWTVLANAVSEAWTATGQFIATTAGYKAPPGLDDLNKQLEEAKRRLADLKAEQSAGSTAQNPFANLSAGRAALGAQPLADLNASKLKDAQNDVDALTNKYAAMAAQIARAQENRDSFVQRGAVMAQLPDIAAVDTLARNFEFLDTLMRKIMATGGQFSPILEAMGMSLKQVTEALILARAAGEGFRGQFEKMQESSKIALDAVTAFSPAAKAAIAQRQAFENVRDTPGLLPEQKAKVAQDAYTLSLKQATTAISEQQKERLLASTQATQTAQQELDSIGKSSVEQQRLMSILQAKQNLEAESARSRVPVDNAELARLTDQINAQAKLKQLAAERSASKDLTFDRDQMFRSDTEQAVASKLRGLYGDDYQSHMNDAIAGQIRYNETLKTSQGLATSFTSSFAQDMLAGKSATEALGGALNSLAKSLVDIAAQQLVKQAFGGLFGGSGSGGGLGGLFGGGLSGSLVPSAQGNIFDSGNVVPFARGGVITKPMTFPLGIAGEGGKPEAVIPLARDANGNLGVSAGKGGDGAVSVNYSPSYSVQGSGPEIDRLRETIANDQASFKVRVTQAVLDARSRRVL